MTSPTSAAARVTADIALLCLFKWSMSTLILDTKRQESPHDPTAVD